MRPETHRVSLGIRCQRRPIELLERVLPARRAVSFATAVTNALAGATRVRPPDNSENLMHPHLDAVDVRPREMAPDGQRLSELLLVVVHEVLVHNHEKAARCAEGLEDAPSACGDDYRWL